MRTVLFDLWETLITDAPELQRARQVWRAATVRDALGSHGLDVDTSLLEAAISNTLHAVSSNHNAGRDTDEPGRLHIFLAEFEKLGATTPNPKTHKALAEAICTMPEDHYPRSMPGAFETLAAIKGLGLKTGLISNAGITTAPTLRNMLSHHGLIGHLDTLVFSDELSLAKPSPGMFAAALEALGCEPGDAVFVGDSPLHDIVGARASGMTTVQIGRKQVEGIEPDALIDTLAELIGVLARLDPRLASLNPAGA